MYGLAFPIQISNGNFVPPTLEESIESSIRILMSYNHGDRDFLPKFYTGVNSILSEPADQVSVTKLRALITRAIVAYEKRITLRSVDVTIEDSVLLVTIVAVINETQTDLTINV